MAHISFCWELGGGLGHAGRIRALALPLIARGHRVSLVLRDLVLPRRLLAELGLPALQAPLWLHSVSGLPPQPASLAEILLGCGYLDPDGLAGLCGGWRALFERDRPDLIVADYAPTALLAARSLGLRSAAVGPGFSVPPAAAPLPQFALQGEVAPARLAAAEARLLASANAVLDEQSAAPLAHACDLLRGDDTLLCTWPELDHYGRTATTEWLGPNLPADTGVAPDWPGGQGPRAFVYFPQPAPEQPDCLAALLRQGCRVLCYMPAVAAGKPPPLTHAALRYAHAPVALRRAFEDCALFVGMAGEASVTRALLGGVPALLLPHSAESFLLARRVRQLGAGINAREFAPAAGQGRDWDGMVRALLGGARHRAVAQDFARRYRGYQDGEQAALVAARLEALLP